MFADAIAFALEWHRATMTAWSQVPEKNVITH